MDFRLPLTLKVRKISPEGGSLAVECDVHDADGKSVGYHPMTVGPRTTAAGLSAILQAHITALAASMHKRGATTASAESPEEEEKALSAMVGSVFHGSVTQ